MNNFQVIRCENPFNRIDRSISTKTFKQDTTLLDIYCEEVPSAIEVAISINGKIVPLCDWEQTYIKVGDQILIIPEIQGNDENKNPFATIAMIVIVVVAAYLTYGTSLYASGGMLAGYGAYAGLIGAAFLTVGGLLVNALLPPSGLKIKALDGASSDSSQQYSWNPATVQQQGQVIPHCYGLNKVYGNIITGFLAHSGAEHHANVLLALGLGPVSRIYDFRINDQLVKEEVASEESKNFAGTFIEVRNGTLAQSVIANFNDTKTEFTVTGGLLHYETAYEYETEGEDFDGLEIEVVAPSGLFYASDGGGFGVHEVGVKVEIRKKGDSEWINLSRQAYSGIIVTDGEVERWCLGRWWYNYDGGDGGGEEGGGEESDGGGECSGDCA